MPRKQYHQLRLDNLQDNLQHNVNTLATVLSYMDRGRLIITLEIEGTRLHLLKKEVLRHGQGTGPGGGLPLA